MSLTHPCISPEAVEAAKAIGRAVTFTSEQKRVIANLMTPLLEQWAAEQAPAKRKAAA